MNIELLKYVGSILAGVVGIMRTIPLVAGYLSRHKTAFRHTRRLRIVSLKQPLPWRDEKWPDQWSDENVRRKYWRRYKITFAGLAFLSLFAGIFFVYLAQERPQPLFVTIVFYIVAVFYGYVFVDNSMLIRNIGRRAYEKWSPFRRQISFTVAGAREDIVQHCYTALELIGANVVILNEAQGILEASTGLWIRPMFAGQRLSVSLSSSHCGSDHTVVTMSSDDVTNQVYLFSPHARNVNRFLRQWESSAEFSWPAVYLRLCQGVLATGVPALDSRHVRTH